LGWGRARNIRIIEEARETARGLHAAGVIDKRRMREYETFSLISFSIFNEKIFLFFALKFNMFLS